MAVIEVCHTVRVIVPVEIPARCPRCRLILDNNKNTLPLRVTTVRPQAKGAQISGGGVSTTPYIAAGDNKEEAEYLVEVSCAWCGTVLAGEHTRTSFLADLTPEEVQAVKTLLYSQGEAVPPAVRSVLYEEKDKL